MNRSKKLLCFIFVLSLSACGGSGGGSSATKNVPPVAAAGEAVTVLEGEQVTLDASGSSDSDGFIESYEWKEGETVLSTESNFSKSDFTAGEHTITLTVTDDDGATATDTVIVQISIAATAPLNDTGITRCANADNNDLDCAQADFPGQDAEHGRDVTHNDDSDGQAGFSFTKLDASGDSLPASATEWSCVKDNVTSLIWEVKTDDGGLRDKDNTYSWYNPDSNTNGGSVGTENGGTCPDTGNCDTDKYVTSVNATGLCGLSEWRMPVKEELRSIVNYGTYNPSIDTGYFPNTRSSYCWASSPSAYSNDYAWLVPFHNGNDYDNLKKDNLYVRLVHSDSN